MKENHKQERKSSPNLHEYQENVYLCENVFKVIELDSGFNGWTSKVCQ